MIKDIVSVKDKVKDLLYHYPILRDDDQMLYLAFLCKHYGLHKVLGVEKYNILRKIIIDVAPKYESVRRTRQKIQESGLCQGLNRKGRKKEQEEMTAYVGHNKDNAFFGGG